jgi:glutathione S-transferase
MKLYLFPLSGRVLGLVALKNHLNIDCQIVPIDLGKGDQRTREYAARNPNMKMPMLEDGDLVLWESNAILFYLANKRPESGLWPKSVQEQADVLRWLCWESAHWDAESIGMVTYEKASKAVLGKGQPDPAFIKRGEENFSRFAAVLDTSLRGRKWLLGDGLTVADFSIGGLVPSIKRMQLPIDQFAEIKRWYDVLSQLPSWTAAVAAKDAAMESWQDSQAGR